MLGTLFETLLLFEKQNTEGERKNNFDTNSKMALEQKESDNRLNSTYSLAPNTRQNRIIDMISYN